MYISAQLYTIQRIMHDGMKNFEEFSYIKEKQSVTFMFFVTMT